MEENRAISEAAEKEDIKIYRDEPMSRHTTMRVGGPAAMLAEPRDIRELVSLVYLAHKNNFRCMVMGNGSNLIFPDEGYRGMVVKTVPHFTPAFIWMTTTSSAPKPGPPWLLWPTWRPSMV